MGVGQSNYSERDFEEKPLEEEEIEKLLEELPSSDKLKSLTEMEKIKILKTTDDKRIYDTVGDEIFNYHIQNNKQNMKKCISNQINDNKKSCNDKVVSRIITQVPGIIKEPLQERIEKNREELQSKFNKEKMSFMEEKRKWDTEKNKLSNNIKSQEKKYTKEKQVFDEFWKGKETSWNKEKQNLTQVSDKYKSERDASRANEKVLKTTLSSKQKQWADKQKSLEEERLEVTKGCNTATQKIIKEKDNLQQSKDKLQLNYKTLETSKKTLKEQYDTLITDKKNLKGRYDNLLSTKNDLDKKIVNLSTEKNNFKIERDEARTTGQTYKTERDTYKTERDTYKTESEKLDKQVKELVLKIKMLSDPFGPYPVSKNECMSSTTVKNVHSQAKYNDKFPNPGKQPAVSSYWSSMPSGCTYYTDPVSPDYNRIVFDTGADTHNNESNVKNSNCESGWCLPSASYRVCKNADNIYKILDSPKDKCSNNLFMVVGVNHSNGNDGTYFNYDLDAANDSLKYFNGGTVEYDKEYTVYNHRTNEIMNVILWTKADSKSNYSKGITNKGHGRRTDSLAYFAPGDNLSFVNHVIWWNSGSPIDNMSEEECKAWADARTDKTWRGSGTWDYFGIGCSVHKTDMGVWYNKKDTGVKCGKNSSKDTKHMCVSKGKGIVAYPNIYTGNIEEKDSGYAARNVSLGECKAYAVKHKIPWFGVETDAGGFPPGCSFYKFKGYESTHGLRYNVFKKRKAGNCGSGQTTCIQKKLDFKVRKSGAPIPNVTEAECHAWADINSKGWVGTGDWKGDPKGCYTDGKNTWFNNKQTSHNCGKSNYNCVER